MKKLMLGSILSLALCSASYAAEYCITIPDEYTTVIQRVVDKQNAEHATEVGYANIDIKKYFENILLTSVKSWRKQQDEELVNKGTEAIKNLPDGVREQVLAEIMTKLNITQ